MRVRRAVLVGLGLIAGIAIALVDSRAGWDSTGITAVALIVAAGLVAGLAGDRPWLWALLVGLPTPIIEIAGGADSGALLAVAFSAIGAALGWAVARAR